MKKKQGWNNPQIWVPILVVLISAIFGPIIVERFKNLRVKQDQPLISTHQRNEEVSTEKQEFNPMAIKAPFDVAAYFYPSGWMGDRENIYLNTDFRGKPRLIILDDNSSTCIKIIYSPGSRGWAGIFWQCPDSNWGEHPGKKITGATKITFWATGEKGSEVVEFKAGGIRDSKKPYHDSFEISLGRVTLTNEWRKYEITLAGQDLSSVIGAFAWVATGSANPGGVIFYLDDIRYE